MDSHCKSRKNRQLTVLERWILLVAGENGDFDNHFYDLPYLESLKTFVMLCHYSGFNNANAFWKEYRLLSDCIADTSGFYIHTPIPKRNGNGYRHIYKVDNYLSFYQRRIKDYILDEISDKYTSPYAYAYKPGVSVLDNARVHVGHGYMVKMDVKDFFDNTKEKDVYRIFGRYTPYNKEVKSFLTKLVCHNGHLSQGACTSPQLANLALLDFDTVVADYCLSLGISYTRYCDDLTFSSNEHFDFKALIDFVTAQLKLNHYRPNNRKTKILRKGDRHIVTGLVVNNEKLRVPSEYKHNLRQELYYIKKYGVSSHLDHKELSEFGSIFTSPDKRHEESYLNMLIGRAGYACRVDPYDRELRMIRYELIKYQERYAQEFRELFARYDSYAKAVCAGHILLQQGSCKLKGVYYPFCHYEGMTVRIAFRPRKTKENLAFLNSRWLLKNENFLFLNTHRVSCCKDMEFSFFVPTHEFSKMESIITACMDELLTIYSRLTLKGYIAG